MGVQKSAMSFESIFLSNVHAYLHFLRWIENMCKTCWVMTNLPLLDQIPEKQ